MRLKRDLFIHNVRNMSRKRCFCQYKDLDVTQTNETLTSAAVAMKSSILLATWNLGS